VAKPADIDAYNSGSDACW